MKVGILALLGAVLLLATPAMGTDPLRGPYPPNPAASGSLPAPVIITGGDLSAGDGHIYFPANTAHPGDSLWADGDGGIRIYGVLAGGQTDPYLKDEFDTGNGRLIQVGEECIAVPLSEPTAGWVGAVFVRFFQPPAFATITRISCVAAPATADLDFDLVMCAAASTCAEAKLIVDGGNCDVTQANLTLAATNTGTAAAAALGMGLRAFTETAQTDEIYLSICWKSYQ